MISLAEALGLDTQRALRFGFLLMGFTFTVTQALLIRELLVAFFGNELSIGLILACWLILEAAGSGLLGKLAQRWGMTASSFAGLQLLFALFLPLCLYAVYISRSLVGAVPGEGVGLLAIFSATFFILTPLALVDGAMFTFGCRAYARLTGQEAPSIGQVYVYEALGAIIGGIVFTYLFIPFLYSVQIVLLLSGLNLLSATLIIVSPPASAAASNKKRRSVVAGVTLFLALTASGIAIVSPLANDIQRWLTRQQWAGNELIYSENSVYGNVAAVQRESQYTFYADGIPILTTPVPDVALIEDIVHLPMLFVREPRRALVLSGGVGGVLHELGKYPLLQIDYAELDPLLIEAVEKFPTPLTRSELEDPRVRVEHVDGRLMVRNKALETAQPKQAYDLVIVNLPYPSTLQLNRFYTVEFFRMVRSLLSETGVVVVVCPASLVYMSDELRQLNNMMHHTLQQALPHVRPIPGDLALWLGSPSEEISVAATQALLDRWEGRGLETKMLTAPYIRLRLEQRYLDWFWASLDSRPTDTPPINRDLHPLGLFYGLSYWNALFSPQVARVLAFTGRVNLWNLALAILATVLLLMGVARLSVKARAAIVPCVIITTGITGMIADIMMIFTFQTLWGHVYHWIGLLITSFMGGLSLGGLVMTRRLARITRDRSDLLKLELALVLFWALLPMALSGLYTSVSAPLALASLPGVLLFLNAVAGFLVGAEFPLANKIWLKRKGSHGGGALYAADLIGAFLGAILVSVVLIPVLGIRDTCLLAALLKLGSLSLVAAFLRSR
jgi:spermidine synthase